MAMIHRRDPFLKEISTQVNTILHEELYKIEFLCSVNINAAYLIQFYRVQN